MRMLHIFVAIILLVQLPAAQAQRSDEISISVANESYLLTVPISRLELLLPKTTLSQVPLNIGGSTSNPRYFHFNDTSRGLIISGWFESSTGYKGINQFWEQELSSWKKSNLPVPTDVSIEKVGVWDVIFYEQPITGGSSAHVRAHRVQSGTWIDLHISSTTRDSYFSNRAAAEALLKSIMVREKSNG